MTRKEDDGDEDEEKGEEGRRLNEKITQEEVDRAIKQLKNEKAAGQDGIIGEVMKKGGQAERGSV